MSVEDCDETLRWDWATQVRSDLQNIFLPTSQENGNSISIGHDNSSYVTGQFNGTATFGTFVLTTSHPDTDFVTDIFVGKLNPAGKWIWVTQTTSPTLQMVADAQLNLASGNGISVDCEGNSYVTGSFLGTTTFGNTTITLTSTQDSLGTFTPNVFVGKINESGIWQWVKQAGSSRSAQGNDISMDSQNNLYVTGFFSETVIFGNTTISLTSEGSLDIFIAKIDQDGEWQWARSAGGINSDQGLGISVDDEGHSYVTGWFTGTATFGTLTFTSSEDPMFPGFVNDLFVSKLDPMGTWQWTTVGGPGQKLGNEISLDCEDNVYVTGSFTGTATFGTLTFTTSVDPNIGNLNSDIFIAKLNSSGEWQHITVGGAGGTGNKMGTGISLDCQNNVYVTGSFRGDATFGTFVLTTEGSGATDTVFVGKLDPMGQWQQVLQTFPGNDDRGNSISVDCNGNAYITGRFNKMISFGTTTFSTRGAFDIFVAKVPTTNCDLPEELDVECQFENINSITIRFNTNACFVYDIYSRLLPNGLFELRDTINGTGQNEKVTIDNLIPFRQYEFRVDCRDKCDQIVDTDTVTCTTICILPGATVLTPSGKKLIDNIVAGDIVIDEHGKPVKVTNNIKSGPNKKKVITFSKNCFGSRKPDANLSITMGHPIKKRINGPEILVENCVNNGLVQSRFMKVSHTYTLMTKERCFVMTNGIPVATYSEADFEKECQKMKGFGTPLLYQLL